MNKAEADKWLYDIATIRKREYKFSQVDLAENYLEAIEKAKVLEKAMEEVIEEIKGCYEGDVLINALKKWRETK